MGGKNKFQRKFAENFPRLDRSKMWLRKTAKIYAPVSTNDNLETNSGYFPSELQGAIAIVFANRF